MTISSQGACLLVQIQFWKLQKTVSDILVKCEKKRDVNLSWRSHRPSAHRTRTENSFIWCLTPWEKTIAPLPETLERSKGMEKTWSLQGNPSFSFILFYVMGTGAKVIVVQLYYEGGGSGHFCWKRKSVKLISPGLLFSVLFSETVSFMILRDDDRGLKPNWSWRLQMGSISISCGKWAYLLSVPKYWKIKLGRNQYMTSREYVNWKKHLFPFLHEICSWMW